MGRPILNASAKAFGYPSHKEGRQNKAESLKTSQVISDKLSKRATDRLTQMPTWSNHRVRVHPPPSLLRTRGRGTALTAVNYGRISRELNPSLRS